MKKIDSLELYPATELEIVMYELLSGERVFVFEDCTGKPPVIYKLCLDDAMDWIKKVSEH